VSRCPTGCTCPRAHHPRFEGPVLAFVVVTLTTYACVFCWAIGVLLGAWP